jgi:hypothetical protein
MVGAEHDLACADLRHEMPQAFRGEYQGVEKQLVEIFRRLLLQRDVRIAVLRRDEAGVIAARGAGSFFIFASGSHCQVGCGRAIIPGMSAAHTCNADACGET